MEMASPEQPNKTSPDLKPRNSIWQVNNFRKQTLGNYFSLCPVDFSNHFLAQELAVVVDYLDQAAAAGGRSGPGGGEGSVRENTHPLPFAFGRLVPTVLIFSFCPCRSVFSSIARLPPPPTLFTRT